MEVDDISEIMAVVEGMDNGAWQSTIGTVAFPSMSVIFVLAVLQVHTPYLSFMIVFDTIDVPVTVGGEGMPGAASATSDMPTVPFKIVGVFGEANSGG